MKRVTLLLGLLLAGCSTAPKMSSFFGNDSNGIALTQNTNSISTISMMLPLSGNQQTIGQDMQRAALLALNEQPDAPVRLLFFDTKGTPEGTQEAYKWAQAQNSDLIMGPVFANELAAISTSLSFNQGTLSYTSDSTLLNNRYTSFAVLIPDQINQLVQYACDNGQRKLAALGPENKTGEIVMNALDSAIKKCPGMTLETFSLYPETEENITPYILKMLPKMVDPKKKDLTPEEQQILATPMIERLDFDHLFVFEDGIRLSQVMAILAFYDVHPKMMPIYTLASAKNSKDKTLNGVIYADLPILDSHIFARQYQQIFNTEPSALASLSYDSVSWAMQLANENRLSLSNMQSGDTYQGINGLIQLNSDGSNRRGLRIVQKTSRSATELLAAPTELVQEISFEMTNNPWNDFIPTTSESIDSASMSPVTSDESHAVIDPTTPVAEPVELLED